MSLKEKLRFERQRTKLPLARAPGDQGLTADGKVQLRGNRRAPPPSPRSKGSGRNKGARKSTAKGSKFPDQDDYLAKLARGENDGPGPSANLRKFSLLANKKTRRAKPRGGANLPPPPKGRDRGDVPPPPLFKRAIPRKDMGPLRLEKAPNDDELSFSDFSSDGESMYESDEGDSLMMSDHDSVGDDSFDDDDYSSLSGMSSTGRDIPLDDSMSLPGERPAKKGGPAAKKGGGGMFTGMTDKDAEEAEKADLLARFHFLKQRGTHISKNYTPRSSLNEMRMEMGRIEHEAQVAHNIKINRRMLLMGVSALEEVTGKFGPRVVRGKLHRVSHFVRDSIKEYDSAFERMAEDYGGVIGAITGGNPLREILFTLGFQIITYVLFHRGMDSAKANEEMTTQDVMSRFPKLVEKAAKEYAEKHNLLMKQDERIPQHYYAPGHAPNQTRPPYAYHHRDYQPHQQRQPHSYNATGYGYPPMDLPRDQPDFYFGPGAAAQSAPNINTEDESVLDQAASGLMRGSDYKQGPDFTAGPREGGEGGDEDSFLLDAGIATRNRPRASAAGVREGVAESVPLPDSDDEAEGEGDRDSDSKASGDLVIDIQ